MEIPDKLYRCDSDSKNTRKLRHTLGKGEILTNMSNGGSGGEIFKLPFENFVSKHVLPGWSKTHFLSFSEKEEIALKYSGYTDLDYYEDDEEWDFGMVVFGKEKLVHHEQVIDGIYYCKYEPLLKSNVPLFSIILIDVVKHLQFQELNKNSNFNGAILLAKMDKEWLILPASPFRDNPREFTSKLDEGCFVDIRKLKAL